MNINKLKYYILALLITVGMTSLIAPKVYAEVLNPTTPVTAPDKGAEEGEEEEEEEEEANNDRAPLLDENGNEVIDVNSEEAGEDDEEEEDEKGVYEEEEIVVTGKDGNEEIIEVPEGLIIDETGENTDFLEQKYLTSDTAAVMQNVIPVYDQQVYMDRLKRMPTAIEMPWNPIVQKFIDRYSGRLRRSVSIMLGAQNFYMPIFEQALEVYDLPLELKYLPVIESALKPNAVSRVGATGLWQFMVATGKRYSLKVNSMIDERRDPVKASYAAAHYLSDMYQIFGDWALVIAAYNCGPGNIMKAIQRSGGKRDYWEIYPYLPAETRGYVPAFIAANYIMTYYCEHNITPATARLPEETDTIMLYQNLHFKQVAEVLGMEMDELRALNPQYRRDVVTGYSEPTDLRLPKEYIAQFIEKQDEIFAYDVSDIMKRDVVEVNEAKYAYKPSKRSYRSKKNVRSKKNRLLKNKKSKKGSSKKSSKKSKKSKKKKKGSKKKRR
jgi:membrane-bound lytic murein transglycosylase D